MFYLILAIISSGIIALIFKYNENNNIDRLTVTSGNYLTAFIISAIISYKKTGVFIYNYNFYFLLFSFLSGFIYFYTFVLYQKNVKTYGASTTGIFMKLGIFIPMILSMIIWKEIPSFLQLLGLVGAILSIVIINYDKNVNFFKNLKFMLLILFITGGLCDFISKIFQKYGDINYKESFLFLLFFSCFIFSVIYGMKNSVNISKKALVLGGAVGIPNLFSSFFLIMALDTISGPVAFSFYSVGSLLFIIIGSYLLFKEKIKKKDIAAFFLTFLSLILINIKI
jgi:drug/metabolite transporter (DMT)-like permease